MIANCQFLQHCLLNPQKITYGEWLSMLTNVVRGTDGIDKCHELSSTDKGRYTPKGTDFRLSEALKMNPHTCDYIKATHSFKCPSGGCGVKSPCSFSLGRIDQARAKVNMIGIPSAEKIFNPDILNALSIIKHQDPTLYAKTKDKLKGTINLRDLEAAIKQIVQSTNLEVLETLPSPDIVVDIPCGELSGMPEDVKIPSAFRVTNVGINYVKITDNGPILVRACGCPAYIKARLYNKDTDSESLKISYRHMGQWRDLVVPRSVAVNSRLVISLSDRGLAVSSESARYAAKYFDDYLFCNPSILIHQAVSRLGWRGREFVFPGLSSDIEIDVDDIGSRHAVRGLMPAGELSDWVIKANTVRNYSPSARFILSAGFASPLLKLLSQRNFHIHNHGGSLGGKTATLWLAMSIWGEPNTIIYNFDNTPTSVERRASLFSDLPFGINEREVLSQSKKQDISSLVYMLAEGKGKGRGGKTGLQELNTWRTIVMTTGEGPLSSAASFDGFMSRMIELEGGPIVGDLELSKSLYAFLPSCCGYAGITFLTALMSSERGEIINFYREAQKWLKLYYLDRIDSHLDALACVMTADYYSSVWVFEDDPLNAKSETYAMGTAIAEKLIKKSAASESERAWLEFMDWIGVNHEKLSNSYSNTKIGLKDDYGNIYIIRSVVNEFLEKYSSAKKIIQEWSDTGKIRSKIDSEGVLRFDIRKTLGGAQIRCITFKGEMDSLFKE